MSRRNSERRRVMKAEEFSVWLSCQLKKLSLMIRGEITLEVATSNHVFLGYFPSLLDRAYNFIRINFLPDVVLRLLLPLLFLSCFWNLRKKSPSRIHLARKHENRWILLPSALDCQLQTLTRIMISRLTSRTRDLESSTGSPFFTEGEIRGDRWRPVNEASRSSLFDRRWKNRFR